jgi:TetR/AcrR family tetracycline transcriptional repressor
MLVDVNERAMGFYEAPQKLHLMITEGIESLTYGSALFCAAYQARNKPAWPTMSAKQYPRLTSAIGVAGKSHEKRFSDLLRRFLNWFEAPRKA